MKIKILVLLSLAILSGCHHTASKADQKLAKKSGPAFPQSSQQLSKWVRSNVGDYWAFEKQNNSLGSYADAVGVVMGDTHLANFGPIPVKVADGSIQMRYLDIDFDDAGRAPFAYDLLRLVITTKATKKEAKVKAMVASYIKGLTGGPAVPAPADITQDLSLTGDQYLQTMSTDLDTKVSDTGFKFKPGKIEPYSGPITKAIVAPFVPDISVIDIALRPVVDGGSKGGLRIWIYGKDHAGLRRLYELKQYIPTSLAAWGPQLPMRAWSDEVRRAMWPDIAHGEYELVDIPNQGPFWLREKKLTLIDIPYSSQDKKGITLVQNLAIYDAYILGTLHARQVESAPLAARLRSPVEQGAFQMQVKMAAKIYLSSVATRAY
jgi:hypothetical protein